MKQWSINLVTQYDDILFRSNLDNLFEDRSLDDLSGGILRITDLLSDTLRAIENDLLTSIRSFSCWALSSP